MAERRSGSGERRPFRRQHAGRAFTQARRRRAGLLAESGGGLPSLAAALASIDDAQRMAGKLDQSANSRAGEAARIVSNVLDAVAKR